MEPLKGNWRRFYGPNWHHAQQGFQHHAAGRRKTHETDPWALSLRCKSSGDRNWRRWDVQLPKLENWKFKCNRLLINRHVLHTSDYTQINLTGSVFTVCECCRIRPGIILPFHLDPWSQSRSKLALTSGSRNDNGKWRHGWTEMVVEESQPLKLLSVFWFLLISFACLSCFCGTKL